MKILLLRVGRLGDMVMILPALKEIIQQFPEAQIHAITSSDGVRLLNIAGIEKKNLMLYRSSIFYRFIDALKVRRYIKRGNFDRIYCFETKKRMISWLLDCAEVIQPQRLLEHYATRCLKLVNPLMERLHQDNYLSINTAKEKQLNEMLRTQQITENTILIGFHPTFSGYNKFGRKKQYIHRLWPWQNFVKLSLKLSEYAHEHKIDLKMVMDLLPNEHKLGQQIQQNSQNRVILLPSAPDFQQYLCLIHRLNVLIVPNTGVMHLAAALNTPLIALFSGMHPNDCGPYLSKEKFTVLRAEDTLTPQVGISSISVEQVYESTINLLEKAWSNWRGFDPL